MSTKCNACGATICNIQYMECSRIECKKTYDLNCLSLSTDEFETYTQHYKNKWICPECICSLPKSDNTNTPLRGLNKTFEASTFVNMSRGNRQRTDCEQGRDAEHNLVMEIRELRSEITSRFDEQAERFQRVWDIVCDTRSELKEMQTKIEVLENKVSTFESLEIKLRELAAQNHLLSEQLGAHTALSKSTEGTYSYAQTADATTTKSSARNVNEVNTDQAGATKITTKPRTPAQANVLMSSMERRKDVNVGLLDRYEGVVMEESNGVNNNIKRKLPAKKVLRGENESLNLEAIERKKHLHIWRLQPNTTVEQMQKHVENLCGSEVKVKVEKIVHKTERDYASFIVGVPERVFEKISHPKAWPRNAEFGEWIWFRRNSNKPREGN